MQSEQPANSDVQTLDRVRKRLNNLHGIKRQGWREIASMADFEGIPPGTLSAIAKGREPKKAIHRKILNLPPLRVETEPCQNPDCDGFGQVHKWDCQTQVVRPKPARKRKARTRIAADVSEEQREALHDYAADFGRTWSELCRDIANTVIKDRT